MANNFEIVLPVNSFVSPSTNFPQRAVVQNRPYLAFDDTTTETTYSIAVPWPVAYTGSGTLKCDVFYIMASATSGAIEWEVGVEAITPADAVDLDSASSFDTVNTGTDTVPGTAGYLGKITVTLTNKDSVAAGDLVRISLARDADDGTNDTATGDARVLSVRIYEEA